MLVSCHNYVTKWFFAISPYEHEHALPSFLQARTFSNCKCDLPLMESPDLEIHTNEQLKSKVLTAFVYAFSTFQRNFRDSDFNSHFKTESFQNFSDK